LIKDALAKLLDGYDLSRKESREVMDSIMSGDATPAQIGGFLVALRLKGETADEIAGAAEAMRTHVVPVHPRRDDLVDTAGTGGDGGRTFNISTAAALVAAAAGAGVAKHGNRSVSSQSGSADVLESLGFDLALEPQRIADSIDTLGFGFMFAPSHHPAMKHAGPVRTELATRTVFNVLGPLTNPAGAKRQVIGVSDPHFLEPIAGALARLGADKALVVSSSDGLDEMSTSSTTRVVEVDGEDVRAYEVAPEDLGIARAEPNALQGGKPEVNADVTRRIFAGEHGPARDVAVLNAGAAIYVSGTVDTLEEGVRAAEAAIDDGRATQALENLVNLTKELAP